MKQDSYTTEAVSTNQNLLISKCTCKAGGSGNEKVVCVHSLVPLYQLTLLITSGHLAEHILVEFTNMWGNCPDSTISCEKLQTLKKSLLHLIIATGVYEWVDTNDKGMSIQQLMQRYNVGKCEFQIYKEKRD